MTVLCSIMASAADIPARWNHGAWTTAHAWTHILSDLATWVAYTTIPCFLAYFAMRRKDAPYPRLLWLFCAFIFVCGLVHLVEALTFWWPAYRLSAALKVSTAAISWVTVFVLVPVIPHVLHLRSPEELEREIEKAAKELRMSETRTRAILDTAAEAIITIDSSGTIQSLNPAAVRIFGYQPEEAIRQNISMLMPEPYRSEHSRYLSEYLRTGVAKIIGVGREVVGRRKDGTTFPMDIAVGEMWLGEERLFTGIVRDATDRKRAEEEILRLNRDLERRVAERTAELEASNKELESFTYSVSHDLRAPLRHIDGYAQILVEECGELVPQDSRRHLGTIQASARKLGTLIDELLTLSRLGRKPLDLRSVDCERLIRSIWEELSADLEPGRFVFEIKSLPSAAADETMLRQAWINLIDNAIKYSSARDSPRIVVDSFWAENATWYRIADNGVGFDSRYADKLFGAFQRLHRESEFPGTGVGLAIVQRIVHRHGGQIRGRGEPQCGATFEFTLGK